jgi:hypothetical protein
VAEHGTAQRGVVAGDGTSQSAGFTQCHHRQPVAGIDSHRQPVLGGVTGLTQCFDRDVAPAAASGTGIPPPTRMICRQEHRWFRRCPAPGTIRAAIT